MKHLRHWPWALMAAGVLIIFEYAAAWHVRSEREAYYLEAEYPEEEFCNTAIHYSLSEVSLLASSGRTLHAILELEDMLERADLLEADRGTIEVLRTRILVQRGNLPEQELERFLSPDYPGGVWERALRELLALRKTRGDHAGVVSLLEDVIDGDLTHPVMAEVPFPYPQEWAARQLAEYYVGQGNGKLGFYWADRLKHDFATDFSAPCGSLHSSQHQSLEDLLARTARMDGWVYEPEPLDWNDWSRRVYGPTYLQCRGGFGAGGLLAFAALAVLTRRAGRWPGRCFSWRIIWTRRGDVAKALLSFAMTLFSAAHILLGIWAVYEGFPPNGEALAWMTLVSPFYLMIGVSLFGCFFARKTPIGRARRTRRREFAIPRRDPRLPQGEV